MDREKPVEVVQKSFSFLQECMYSDQGLLEYLSTCSALPDEIQQELKEGLDLVRSRQVIKAILRHGTEECRKVLDFIMGSHLQTGFKEHLSTVDVDAEKFNLSLEKVWEHRTTLYEDMEPSLVADILLEKLVLNIEEHDDVERAISREEKCNKLLSLVEKHKDDIEKFKYALSKSKCLSAMAEMKEKVPEMPDDSMECVTKTYRLLRQKVNREKLFNYMKEKEGMLVPDSSKDIIRSLMKSAESCKALLTYLRKEDLSLYYEVMANYMYKSKKDRKQGENEDNTVDIGSVLCELEFLKKEMEPIPFSDILLEEKLIPPSLHQSIRKESSRKTQMDKILEPIQQDLEKKYDEVEEKWERLFYEMQRKIENKETHKRHHPRDFPMITRQDFAQHKPDTKELEKEFKAPEIEYCVSQLECTAVLDKLREKGDGMQDCLRNMYTLYDYEEKFVLNTKQRTYNEGRFPSSLTLSISFYHRGRDFGNERLEEVVRFLNKDSPLRSRLSKLLRMRIDGAESPLVIHLTSLTDKATHRLLSEDAQVVQKMIKILLDMTNLYINLWEARESIDIRVVITESTSGSRKKDYPHFVKVRIQQYWDLLVRELEPCQLLACFVRKGWMTKTDEQTVLQCSHRQDKVAALLKTLLQISDEHQLEYFVQLLRQLNKKDIADKLYCNDTTSIHQEAESARQNILLHFDEVLENIDTYITERTLRKCADNSIPENVWPKSGYSRKGRAYNLVLFAFEDDSCTLELKNALEYRGFGCYFKNIIANIAEPMQEENADREEMKSSEDLLMDCTYWTAFREGYDPSARRKEKAPVVHHNYYYEDRFRHLRGKRFWYMEDFFDGPEFDYRRCDMMMMRRRRMPMRRNLGVTSEPATKEPEEKKKFVKKYKVVAAIDFGTSYSGYAFSSQDDPLEVVTGKWKTNSSELLESLKTPTSLLFKSNGLIEAFGYDAEKKYKELVEENRHHDYRLFNQLKKALLKKQHIGDKLQVFDHMNRPMDATKVFSTAIGYLFVECKNAMDLKIPKLDKEDVLWVMTVPSLWDNFGKQFLREAAEKAGIPKQQLVLTLEPEVAAIYTIKGSRPNLTKDSTNQYAKGTKILLVDLGGGTADFSLMGVGDGGCLEVLHEAIGGVWGGTTINLRVWEILEELFTKEVIDEFKNQTSDYLEMESNIELKKRDLSSDNKLLLLVYPSLATICKEKTGKSYKELVEKSEHAGDVKVRTGKIIFEPKMIEKIFERTLQECFSVMDKILNNGKEVKDIILVGGFSESDIIQKQFQKKYSDYRLMIPTDPGLAVLKGAVIFGHDETMVKCRISPHTYGVDVLQFGFDSDPEDKKKVFSGTTFCSGTFHKLVARGQKLEVAKDTEVEVFSPKISAKQLFLNFYQTDEPDLRSITDEGCEFIGKLVMDIPNPPFGNEPLVNLSIKFGEIEITVKATEKITESPVETSISFLEGKP